MVARAWSRLCLRPVQVGKPLGVGGFARVMMARDSTTRRMYAFKVVNKQKLLAFNASVRCEAVLREKQARAAHLALPPSSSSPSSSPR